MENPHSILKKVFGYDSFRPGQEEIVSALLAGRDALAIMPTGAGGTAKRFCSAPYKARTVRVCGSWESSASRATAG